jgi:hypothetical protein
VDDVIYGKRTPEAALAKARLSTQRELGLVLGGREDREASLP